MIKNSMVILILLFSHNILAKDNCADPQMIKWIAKTKNEISARKYLTLATVDKNFLPWNAPVYSAFDVQYHFYWMSARESQHAKNIRLHPNTFAVIYDSTVREGAGFGVYLRGDTKELNRDQLTEIAHGIKIMGDRIHQTHKPLATNYLPPFPRRLYRFTPHRIWVNAVIEEQGKKIDVRREITQCFLNVR